MIGAGPAGAVAARQLALQGLQTLLVERQAWPRNKVCGGCLNGHALSVLETIGLERILDDSRAAPLTRLIVHAQTKKCGSEFARRGSGQSIGIRCGTREGRRGCWREIPARHQSGDSLPRNHSREVRQVKLTPTNDSDQLTTARIVIAADGLGHPSLKAAPEFSCQILKVQELDLRSASNNCRHRIVPVRFTWQSLDSGTSA